MDAANSATTVLFRWLAWLMNVTGHIFIWMPFINLVDKIPLVGWLLSNIFLVAVVVFGCLWATALHLLVMAIAWIVYRPLMGILLLCGVFGIIIIMNINPGKAKEAETEKKNN